MRNATLSNLKNNLGQYMRYVRRGETILILERGRPLAEIMPRSRLEEISDHDLVRLEADGLIKRGSSTKNKKFCYPQPGKSGVLEDLLNERQNSQ